MMHRDTMANDLLLDGRGRLLRSFWDTQEDKEYNRDRLSRLRGKEWEHFQLLGRNYVFRLLFGHFGGIGFCRAVFTDLRTGRYSLSGPLQLSSGDSFHLDYGVSQPHHFYRDQDGFFLSLDHDWDFCRIRCHTDEFDVELMLPVDGDPLISAAPGRDPKHFFYCGRRVYPSLRGAVSFLGRSYSLQDAFVASESCRAVLPFQSSRIFCCGSQIREDHSLSLILGWGLGYAGAGLENALFLDGKLVKLNRVREERQGNYLEPCRFYSDDGSVDLIYQPLRDELFARDYRLLYFRSHCSTGFASGNVELRGKGTITIDRLPMICERTQCRL